MLEIKKIDILSAVKVVAAGYAAIGLIVGAISTFVSLVGAAIMRSGSILFGVGSIIFLPILYGFFGVLAGALGGLIYNLIASWIGGIKIETDKSE